MESLRERVRAWLREDAVERDVTSAALVSATAAGRAVIRAKEHGVVAGLDVAREVFAVAAQIVGPDAAAPAAEPVAAPVAEPVAEPVAAPAVGSVVGSVAAPAVGSAAAPAVGPVAEPVVGSVAAGAVRAVSFEALVADGDDVTAGQIVARVAGPARALLAGERTALNVLQRMSGVATLTARFVAAVAGTGARILVTRKTMPGLRDLDLAAVCAGGGAPHRESLADRVLVKENHVAAARAAGSATSMAGVVARLVGPQGPAADGTSIGIEVRDLDELRAALVPGIDVVLIDNFTPALCREAVALRDAAFPGGGGPELEASGGITLDTVRAFAATGVERISTGAPTHSARALDLSMTFEPCGDRDGDGGGDGSASPERDP